MLKMKKIAATNLNLKRPTINNQRHTSTIDKGAYITYTESNHHIFSFINTTTTNTNTDIESTILYTTIDK